MASGGEVKVEIKNESTDEVDFAKIPLSEAFSILQANEHGLTLAECEKRLAEFGPNKLPESTRNPLLVFLGYMWNPLAWAMEIAAIISIALLDYADFALIVALLLVNAVISYVEESNADKAIKALTAALAPKAKALRDGEVKTIDAINLVPGDVIIIRLGDIVPADVKILQEEGGGEEQPMQVDQAALTGESLPVKKFSGDVCFSGSSIKQGERHAIVYATGINTFFGRAAALISATNNVANLQIIMTKIGGICLFTIALWVLIELAVQFGHYDHSCGAGEEACPTLTNMLVIIVGGIPIAMPTVLSVTLALGAFKLAKEGAIVARMSAVEEMAGMDVLCSDKTGTLTLNKLSVETKSVMCVEESLHIMDVLKYSALSANTITEEPIDVVLHDSYPEVAALKKEWKLVKFIPFNPVDKFTCATVEELATGKRIRLLKGSPQVVLAKAYNCESIADAVNNKMVEFANRGFRSLGIAMAEGDGIGATETKWTMLGLLPLFDPPRHDTKETIEKCLEQGISVKMITGDHLLIGKETAKMLGMGTQMYPSEVLIKAKNGDKNSLHGFESLSDMVEKCNGFAEVFPEHKFEIVKILQDSDHIVGMTGDGVNDAPALKKADVGIAVHGATDAARGAADIVLTEPGLSTIVTAVVGARKIFQRMTTYAKYTVAMTFRICFTFGLLTVIYDWYFPTILIVIMAVFNDGAMIALSKDKVVASRTPNSWNLHNIFISGIVYGLYLTLSSWALYQTAVKTDLFETHMNLFSLNDQSTKLDHWCREKIDGDEFVQTSLGYTLAHPSPNAYETSVCGISHYKEALDEYQCFGFNAATNFAPIPGTPSLLEQCKTEQKYVRGAMMRSLLYNHVSISGQALVFVVRNQEYSLMSRAGGLTYVAFVLAQVGSTLIALFGFGGYSEPRHKFEDCIFCGLSTGGKIPFYRSQTVPIALTESDYTASVIGCTGYVIVAWIWTAIWYVMLDPIKWALCWILNEDGFRDMVAFRREKKRTLHVEEKETMPVAGGVTGSTYMNPLGRASLSKPVSAVLDRKSASVVAVTRNSQGISRVSADPNRALGIARRSLVAKEAAAAAPAHK